MYRSIICNTTTVKIIFSTIYLQSKLRSDNCFFYDVWLYVIKFVGTQDWQTPRKYSWKTFPYRARRLVYRCVGVVGSASLWWIFPSGRAHELKNRIANTQITSDVLSIRVTYLYPFRYCIFTQFYLAKKLMYFVVILNYSKSLV